MKKVEDKQDNHELIEIPSIDFKLATITIEGDTPLLVNKFSEKSKKEIEEKSTKKAMKKKEFDKPEDQFMASLYVIDAKNHVYGIPAGGIKKCAIAAAPFVGGDVKKTHLRGAFQIINDSEGLIPIQGSKPVMDSRFVRVGNFGNKKPSPRYRARFDKWEISFQVKYNPRMMSVGQLLNLYENAGFAIGLCEHRPEKDGNLGMFHVKRQ